MQEFCELYNLKNPVKEPTCYKNPENPSCIDLILTDLFYKIATVVTGQPDFHKMTITVMKNVLQKESSENCKIQRL